MDPLKLKPIANTRYSITFAWREFKGPNVAYRLQLRDRLQGWITKYWGFKTRVEVRGLGPEECYDFRVGVTSHNNDCPVWSKIVPANTKDDLILVANLHRSVQYGNPNAVRKFIMNRPYAVDSYNQLGKPTINTSSHPQITTLLLNAGATNDFPARFTGRTALMEAAAHGQVEVATLLLERGASWDTQDRVGCTAVHYAVDTSQIAMVELAVASGANLDIADSCGWTPLLRGVVLGSDASVLSLLINAGVDVLKHDHHGQSGLLLAVLTHRPLVSRMLLDAGASEEDPQQLLSIAIAQGDVEIEALLRAHFHLGNNIKTDGRSTPARPVSTTSFIEKGSL